MVHVSTSLAVVNGLLGSIVLVEAVCNRYTGPAGSNECVLLNPYYNEYQWATCVETPYMVALGYHCRDRTSPHCWYQCMLERYELDEGPVYNDCKCRPGDEDKENPELPEECYSPDGTACDWYKNCLENKYPCSGDVNSYAIDYGQKFCSLYDRRLSYFSAEGVRWINAVRKCLQLALVPHIRDYEQLSCAEIKEAAFDSHAPCYLENGVCQLSCYNWAQVFWTVKSSLIDEFTETTRQMVTVLKDCNAANKGCMRSVRNTVDIARIGVDVVRGNYLGAFIKVLKMNARNSRRSKRTVEECDASCIAREVGKQLADQQKWGQTSIDYVAFGNTTENGAIEIELLLTDWEVINGTSNSSEFLEQTTTQLLDDMKSGRIRVQVEGIQLETVSACSELECESSYANVDVPVFNNVAAFPQATASNILCLFCLLYLVT